MQVKKAVITAAGRGPTAIPGVRHRAEGNSSSGGSRRRDETRVADHRRGGDRKRDRGRSASSWPPAMRRIIVATSSRTPRPSCASARSLDRVEAQTRKVTELLNRMTFAVQPDPLGYGHAVWCARHMAAGEPVLLLLGDHLYVSRETRRCARHLLDLAEAEGCAVSAVQATREHMIHQYGTVQGSATRTVRTCTRSTRSSRSLTPRLPS